MTLDDVTRVMCSNGRIVNIGKVIREFNAIDTGVFLCTPVIFDAPPGEPGGSDDSISGAMNVLASLEQGPRSSTYKIGSGWM